MARRDYDTRGVKQLVAPASITADVAQGSAVDMGAGYTKREVLAVVNIGANVGTASLSFYVSGSDDNSTWVTQVGQITISGANQTVKASLKPYRYYRTEASSDFTGTSVIAGVALAYARAEKLS